MLMEIAKYEQGRELASSGKEFPSAANVYKHLLMEPTAKAGSFHALQGRLFSAVMASAVAPLTAVPTTTSTMTLYNGDVTKWYRIERVTLAHIASTGKLSFFWMLSNVGFTAPAGTITPVCLNRQSIQGTNARVLPSGTVVTANGTGWLPSAAPPTGGVGTMTGDDLDGAIWLPPTSALHVTGFSDNAANTAIFALFWTEHERVAG